MKFHCSCISKRPDILMDMCSYFISGSVYMIFDHPKWNFISVKMTNIKFTPALSFKRTSALNAASNGSALIHFASGKLCPHENLMRLWDFILVKMTDMKSIPFWVSFRPNSCEHKSWLNTKWDFQPKWNLIPIWVHFTSHVNKFINKFLRYCTLCISILKCGFPARGIKLTRFILFEVFWVSQLWGTSV